MANEFFAAENLLVAVGPTQANQVVDQSFGQIAHFLVGHDGSGAVAFGQFRPILPEDHGDVSEMGQGYFQGLVDEDLPGCVGNVVVAPDHMGDVHGDVVDNHGKIVSGDAVAAFEHEVVQFGVVEDDRPLDEIIEHGGSQLRTTETDDAVWSGPQASISAAPVIFGFAAGGESRLAALFQVLGCALTIVGMPCCQQLLQILTVDLQTLGLKIGSLVPGELQPGPWRPGSP